MAYYWCSVLLVCFIWTLTSGASTSSEHPCLRECISEVPQVCEYNFTVEWYYTLSKACHACPSVIEDCFRPHCVSTDGKRRPLITINKQMPGPAIEVCEGDTVRVWVNNQMEDGSSMSIHWHGLHQINTGYMDGVPRLTQCSIPPGELFRYEFRADNAGTHWYHSHEGMQLGDGLVGPFIVRKQKRLEPSASLYDRDESDHVIMIQDWNDSPVFHRYMEEMNWIWLWPPPIAGLVNGRGQRHLVENIPETWENFTASFTPYSVFEVNQNTRYRFRLIGGMERCFFRFSIDNHVLLLIARDGNPVQPVTLDAMEIHPGLRYDFIVNTQQPIGNYWMKTHALSGDCSGIAGHTYGILRYTGADEAEPTSDKSERREGKVLNPSPSETNDDDVEDIDLVYDGSEENYQNEVADVTYYFKLVFMNQDNTRYNHPIYYPVKELPSSQTHITPTISKISNRMPGAAPLFTQWEDVENKDFCDRSTVNEAECEEDLCYCTHTVDIQLYQVLELFMISDDTQPHQMHLHGHNFRLVGGGYHEIEKFSVDVDAFKASDEAGSYPRNLDNAPVMDTVTVNPKQYVIIRFVANNPGVWFFHCHNEGHLMQGMSLIIKAGQPGQFPKPPVYFPKCGGYSYNNKNVEKTKCVSMSTKIDAQLSILILSLLVKLY